jgi:hypothetical protein
MLTEEASSAIGVAALNDEEDPLYLRMTKREVNSARLLPVPGKTDTDFNRIT